MEPKVSAEVTAMFHPGCQVEVRCHPGCPWAAGWEVADVVLQDGAAHYRVRRRGQLRVLAALLPQDDVRAELAAVSRAS
jgi:hypothetical protein